MAESLLQQQLDDVRMLLRRAQDLFGSGSVPPPEDIAGAGSIVDAPFTAITDPSSRP
ncbi:MAG: hypothetical protein WBC17_14695 [Mycobacterium sp.]|nr:hypothetical protein [Mycobacterium sp.]